MHWPGKHMQSNVSHWETNSVSPSIRRIYTRPSIILTGSLSQKARRLSRCGAPHSIPQFRFLQSFIRIEVDAHAVLTRNTPICLDVNDSCCKTIVSSWLAAHFFRNCDEYVHKLAHFWRDFRRKVGAQHGYVYCLACLLGFGLRSVAKPHRNLKVNTRKEATFRLTQVSPGLPTRGTLRWDSHYLERR